MANVNKLTLYNSDGTVKGTYDVKDDISGYQTAQEVLNAILSTIATSSRAGVVKPDGTTITVSSDGTISASGGIQYEVVKTL